MHEDFVYRYMCTDGVPTLGEVQGKIIIIRRESTPYPFMCWAQFTKSDEYDTGNAANKWQVVKANLDKALDGSKEELFVIFTSCYDEITCICTLVEDFNPRVCH